MENSDGQLLKAEKNIIEETEEKNFKCIFKHIAIKQDFDNFEFTADQKPPSRSMQYRIMTLGQINLQAKEV